MPTIHFEYTNNLAISKKIKSFLLEVHHLLVEIIKTDLPTCRSLVTPYSEFIVGDGDIENAFLQITIKMLPGRSEEIKHSLGNKLYHKIQQAFSSEINALQTQVRVYLQDTDVAHYYGLESNPNFI